MKNTRVIGTHLILMFGLVLLVACNCNTNETDHITIEKGSFTDPRDGKIYKTVKIEDQWIMAENYAYKPDTGNFWAYENNDETLTFCISNGRQSAKHQGL
jgi:major membrane immunogen (membrane-anchored lipoprotein)